MKKTAVILQPSYLPWLGYFEQIWKSDVFVLYDDVQFDKNGWRNRNRIKTPDGPRWLTVPVRAHLGAKINEVEIDNRQNWRKKHLKNIESAYQKAPYFEEYFEYFKKIYEQEWKYIAELDIFLIHLINDFLGLDRQILRSSELGLTGGGKVGRLVEICRSLKADVFYEGQAGKNYIDDKEFEDNDIRIIYQNYRHPSYRQSYGDFAPYLSVIDLLFNEGPKSLEIITINSEERNIP